MVGQRDIINRIADKTGLKKKDIKAMLLAFKEVIYDAVDEEETLFLKDTLTIKPINVKGRNRYIAPYEHIIYEEEHKSVKAFLGKSIMDMVRKKYKEQADEEK